MNKYLRQFMESNTQLSESEMREIMERILVSIYQKGTVLLKQGDISDKCYFVLKGCIRQYAIGDDGKETTYNFFTEGQSVILFKSYKQKVPSAYFLSCLEESTLIVGSLDSEEKMYDQFPELKNITRTMMEQNFGQAQDDTALLMGAAPEERYLRLLEKRPGLIKRVPQHQLASYLGITPESLSRIKKRLTPP
ncbi:Crp/Fnr family transcriptional regulator [Desulfitobacterium sp. Sab5]|uniref:Crp/Fnr family transcriptional regulator n=1 Tax=Desulfitobacterium nosdiversum TaxID=3375356 RepID=UPI003CED3FFC